MFRVIGHVISDLVLLSQNVTYSIYGHNQQHLTKSCTKMYKSDIVQIIR